MSKTCCLCISTFCTALYREYDPVYGECILTLYIGTEFTDCMLQLCEGFTRSSEIEQREVYSAICKSEECVNLSHIIIRGTHLITSPLRTCLHRRMQARMGIVALSREADRERADVTARKQTSCLDFLEQRYIRNTTNITNTYTLWLPGLIQLGMYLSSGII